MAANSHCFCLGFLSEPREGFQLKNDESPGCSSQPQPSEHGCEAGPEPILGDLFRVRGFRVSGCGVEIGKDVQGVEAGLFAASGITALQRLLQPGPHVKCWTFRLPLHSIPPATVQQAVNSTTSVGPRNLELKRPQATLKTSTSVHP